MGFFGGGGASASNMVGATSSVAGTAGLVPAPAAGQEGLFLRGDATFSNPTNIRQLDFINATQKGYFVVPISAIISGAAPTANTLYLCPVYLPKYTYTTIRAPRHSGTSGSSTTIRMGLYNMNPKTMEPTTLVFETAETNHFSSSADLDVTISQALDGLYYTAIVAANLSGSTFATLVASRNQSQATSPFITFPSNSSNTSLPGLTYAHSGTSASLPSTLAGSTFTFTTASINFCIFKV